jgi:hypothetical protein
MGKALKAEVGRMRKLLMEEGEAVVSATRKLALRFIFVHEGEQWLRCSDAQYKCAVKRPWRQLDPAHESLIVWDTLRVIYLSWKSRGRGKARYVYDLGRH